MSDKLDQGDEAQHLGEVDVHPDAHRPTETDEEKILTELYGPADDHGVYRGQEA
ncbi:hypothetical protein [Thermomonospora amylolytica]|uniref:hypothetical protein n=1 Tax=Thermomonospora amylolytica TaxID=1411117 RepID=UPI0018E5641B|nr:hypothetical protein [Thermomonospora amylolytica]